MRIAVHLISQVGKRPAGIDDNGKGTFEFPDGKTLSGLLAGLSLRTDEPFMALVNGQAIPPSERDSTILMDGDEVTVFPPMEGGLHTEHKI